MYYESTGKKIWRVVYPVLTHLLIYAMVLFGALLVFQALGYDALVSARMMDKHAALLTALSLLITIPILFLYYRRDYPETSFAEIRRPKHILLLLALAVVASHGFSLLLSLFSSGPLAEGYENVEQAIYASSAAMVLLRGIVLAPLCEELLFRGLVFRRLREYSNFWIGAVLSSVIFAVYHLNLIQGIYAFLLGVILCIVYDRFRNLWANVIVHAAGNLLSVLLTWTGLQYPSTAVYLVVMVLFLFLTVWIFRYIYRMTGK